MYRLFVSLSLDYVVTILWIMRDFKVILSSGENIDICHDKARIFILLAQTRKEPFYRKYNYY